MRNPTRGRWPTAAALPIGALVVGAALLVGGRPRDLPLTAEFDVDSKAEVVRLTGRAPDRCVFAVPGFELCGWRLEASLFEPGVVPEAEAALGVNLVCELPLALATGIGGVCRAHPRGRRTLLAELELPQVGARGEEEPSGLARLRAEELLAEATTLTALSHLLGELPDECRTGPGFQSCRWELGADAPGHPLVAALAGGEGPVTLRCSLPLDGGRRAPESCRTEGGANETPFEYLSFQRLRHG